MKKPSSTRARKGTPPIGKPGRDGRSNDLRSKGARRLPDEFEALARGEKWRPPRRRQIADPRPVALVPGVKNSDARLVYHERLEELRACIASGSSERVAREVAEIARLALWRAGSLASLEALLENALELDPDQVRQQMTEFCFITDTASAEAIAMCLRAEAVLRSAGAKGRAWVEGEWPDEQICLRVGTADAPDTFELIGHRIASLTGQASTDRPASRGDGRRRNESR